MLSGSVKSTVSSCLLHFWLGSCKVSELLCVTEPKFDENTWFSAFDFSDDFGILEFWLLGLWIIFAFPLKNLLTGADWERCCGLKICTSMMILVNQLNSLIAIVFNGLLSWFGIAKICIWMNVKVMALLVTDFNFLKKKLLLLLSSPSSLLILTCYSCLFFGNLLLAKHN